jgi:hypothetical protein
VLTLLAPAERAQLAAQVADALETVYPGLPGEWCQTAAALRLEAGNTTVAGRLFAEAGRRASTQGAANSAVGLLDRAWDLLAHDEAAERADTLEHLVYALAEAGLVERVACPNDRRVAYAALTDAGLERITAAVGPHLVHLDELFGVLSPAERDVFASLLRKVRDHVNPAAGLVTTPEPEAEPATGP